MFDVSNRLRHLSRMSNNLNNHNRTDVTIVKERSWGHRHEVREGAPCEWSAKQGATHTLWLGEGHGRGTRPARLLKSVLYVGIDEDNDVLVWEKWSVSDYLKFGNVTTASKLGFHPVLRREEIANNAK